MNPDYYQKFQLSGHTVWECFVFWAHGKMRPSHQTALVAATSYVVPVCFTCEKDDPLKP